MQKTTIFAIIAAVGFIFTQIGFFVDDDPTTVANWENVIKALGVILGALGIGATGFFAREDSVSDEQAGAGNTGGEYNE